MSRNVPPVQFRNVRVANTLTLGSTDLSATGAELNTISGVTAGTITASKAVIVGSGNQVNEWTVTAASATTTAGKIGTDISLSVPTASITAGSYYAGRSIATLSGTVTGGAFVSGLRTGLAVSGTMNHADSRLAGAFVKLDTTGATLTAGQLSALWVDHGAGVTGAGGGQFNMIRITNTVSGSKPNGVIYAHSNATYLLDLSAPGGTMDWLAASGTSAGSAGKSDGCAAQKVLIVNIGGVPYYIPAFDQNT